MKVLKKELINMDHFQKVQWLRKLLEQDGYDVRSYEELSRKVCRIVNYRGKRINKLNQDEVVLLDLFLKHKISPRTAEDWLRAPKLPDDLKYRYRNKEITFVNAFREYNNTKIKSKDEITSGLRNSIIDTIRRF